MAGCAFALPSHVAATGVGPCRIPEGHVGWSERRWPYRPWLPNAGEVDAWDEESDWQRSSWFLVPWLLPAAGNGKDVRTSRPAWSRSGDNANRNIVRRDAVEIDISSVLTW